MTLANFSEAEVQGLYAQHTTPTGQVFADEATRRAWFWSERQPWLVNALAHQTVEKLLANDYSQTITAGQIAQVASDLMKRRDTHLDSLLARLPAPRVERFIGPMLATSENFALTPRADESSASLGDDLQYCLDLGWSKMKTGSGRLIRCTPAS
ncbi:MAG: hypothetical protein LBR11_10660 [Deltaproteobacteria bacterium]|nr:hypothetical protein [Deltaproteobacteria bacterium]